MPPYTEEALKKMSADDQKSVLIETVFQLNELMSRIKLTDDMQKKVHPNAALLPIAADDLDNIKMYFKQITQLDKILRKPNEPVYTREEKENLIQAINILDSHKLGVKAGDLGLHISYLQANGVHNPKKDEPFIDEPFHGISGKIPSGKVTGRTNR